jgi:alkane 1-monooxygenase/p-cymene monooxygenase
LKRQQRKRQERVMADYLKYYAATVLLAIGLGGFLMGGDGVWLGAATFPVVVFIDSVFPRDYSVRRMNDPFWAAIPVWIAGLGPIVLFLAFAWRIGAEDLSAAQLIGGTLSCAWLALVPGIAAQHELFHARGPWTRTVGRYAQFTLFDGMRDIEHVIYHHIEVSTPADLSTAPRGTSIYRFTPRAVWGTIGTHSRPSPKLCANAAFPDGIGATAPGRSRRSSSCFRASCICCPAGPA